MKAPPNARRFGRTHGTGSTGVAGARGEVRDSSARRSPALASALQPRPRADALAHEVTRTLVRTHVRTHPHARNRPFFQVDEQHRGHIILIVPNNRASKACSAFFRVRKSRVGLGSSCERHRRPSGASRNKSATQ
eukprot:172130-Pleurochrysis_carterae.AAC.2